MNCTVLNQNHNIGLVRHNMKPVILGSLPKNSYPKPYFDNVNLLLIFEKGLQRI